MVGHYSRHVQVMITSFDLNSRSMHYLQTQMTTLQAVMHISQPHALLCVTETVQQRPDPPFPSLVGGQMSYHSIKIICGLSYHNYVM